jgi:formamidopyrimidine-DNA glycosylase
MPEIPELEGLVGYLTPRLVGHRFADVQVAAISAVKTADPPISSLRGQHVTAVGRRGKFLWLATADDLFLVTHLSRAGWLKWYDSPPRSVARMRPGPLAARFTFVDDDGAIVGGFDLTEAGTQKRLSLYLVRRLDDIAGVARLGPEPTAPAFTQDELRAILTAAGGRHLKTVLRDQSVIAGIGNAYSDEILHAARLSPVAPSNSLSEEEETRLFAAIHEVLAAAIANAAEQRPADLKDGKRQAMRVHGRKGQRCDVCGDTIREVSSADSSFQYCPTCQTGGRPLADRRLSRLLK